LNEGIEIARGLLLELLERMGIEAEVEATVREGDLCLEVKGDKKGILIGRHGHTLESLQFLINRMVAKRLRESARVIVDVNDYKKRRTEYLTRIALRIGEKVKARGRSLTMGPFTAMDRRIIHVALREDPFVSTESLGEGEIKRVKILLKEEEGKGSI
jgi:spoIIIJ-associated protein